MSNNVNLGTHKPLFINIFL